MSMKFLSILFLVAVVNAAKYEDCGKEGVGTIVHLNLTGCKDDHADVCVLQHLRRMHLDLQYKLKERDVYNASFRITALDHKKHPLFVLNYTNIGPIVDRVSALMSWLTPITNWIKPVLDWLNIGFEIDYPLKIGEVYSTKFYFPVLMEIPREVSPVLLRVELRDNETQKPVFCFQYKLAPLKQ